MLHSSEHSDTPAPDRGSEPVPGAEPEHALSPSSPSGRRALLRTLLATGTVTGAATALAPNAVAAPPGANVTLPGRRASDGTVIPPTTAAWHLARRFCGAPTIAIANEIARMGPRNWFEWQLSPELVNDRRMEGYHNGPLVLAQMEPAEVARRHNGATWMASEHALKMLMTRPVFGNRHVLDAVCEVLGDHLYVPLRGKASSFSARHEHTIRGMAMGKYADLLHAVLVQPAMLIHLDNHVSTRTDPNENLGRELLELFTVGTGNYSETDMRQSTLLLTGHSYDWDSRAYAYKPYWHHVGPVRIMDFRHPNANDSAGEPALRSYCDYLARHPATAERLARKFAVRFVSDDPSPGLVAAMARAYLGADTAIPAMLRVLFDSNEFWASSGLKWRRPAEVIGSILRAGKRPDFTPRAADLSRYWDLGDHGWFLQSLGHLPRNWPHVDGYPDTTKDWNTAQTTMELWNVAVSICVGDMNEYGRFDWPSALGVRVGDRILATVRRITTELTGWTWTPQDVAAAAVPLRPHRTVRETDTFDSESLGHLRFAVRLIFCSPYAFLR